MMTISKETRVTAKSGDFANVTVQASGKIYVGSLMLADVRELEAFGNALVDVAHEMMGKARCAAAYDALDRSAHSLQVDSALDPSAEDVLIRYADEHTGEAQVQAGS